MPDRQTPLEPQQERSRRTLSRLLQATIRLLDDAGLEGATIPRVAETAGVSPATVYRRFKDKQDLLRAAFLNMLATSNAQNRDRLAVELTRPGLVEAARRYVELSFAQYREHGQLLRALKQTLESDDDPTFVQAVKAIFEDNLNQVIKAMLAYRKEIAHPDPERAVRIAALIAATSVEAIAFAPRSPWATLQPMSDEAFIKELVRGFVAYLKSPA